MYDVGLTLGKFAPFHRGHQALLETALREVRHLIVIVYEAERTTDMPLSIRAAWIRTRYPSVEVLEAPAGPEDTGYSPDVMRKQESFLRSFLAGRRIDAFYSSEPYGDHVSRALGCVNRVVDPGRTAVPVSGTMIRADPWSYRHFLDPNVRADLVLRIVFVGGPSTGKTTLATALAERLGEPWCPEFGRDYWFEHQVDHRLSMAELELIAREQAALERRYAREARRVLVVDTCPLTTWAYARYWFETTSRTLDAVLEDYLRLPRRWWLCDEDIPFDDSPDRSGPASRHAIQRLNIGALRGHGIGFRTVSGTLPARIETVLRTGGFTEDHA